QEISQAIQQLMDTGDRKFRGRYLFAGSRTDVSPFRMSWTGLVEYYLMSRDVEAMDALIGFADGMCHHAMLRDKDGKRRGWTYTFGDYWGPYRWEDLPGRKGATFFVSNFRITQPLGWIYRFTGRQDYLDVLTDATASARKPSLLVTAAYAAVAHPKADRTPPAAVTDLKAERLGDGGVVPVARQPLVPVGDALVRRPQLRGEVQRGGGPLPRPLPRRDLGAAHAGPERLGGRPAGALGRHGADTWPDIPLRRRRYSSHLTYPLKTMSTTVGPRPARTWARTWRPCWRWLRAWCPRRLPS
ncbi:hypothetical protein LCGC14_2470670, partial [marine sediment metagenome]